LKAFNNKCEKFRALPDDDELVGDQMVVTDKKNAAREKLKNAIRSIMTKVSIKYSNRTVFFCGRRVARVARKQIDFLAEVGINDTAINRVLDACTGFEKAINIQQDKVADRDISVERRVEIGNKIYDELVILCNIGKDIWAETDPVKYEQYTIYESNNEQKIARKQKLASESVKVPKVLKSKSKKP